MIDREYAKMCVGAGWHSLVDEAYDLCEKYEVEITQIKEKFGQLRIYTSWREDVTDDLDEMLWMIESRSSSMCECCGAAAGQRNRGGWIKTICKFCEEINDVLAKKGK